jgi:thymidine kinase
MQTEKTKNMQLFAWALQQQDQNPLFLLPRYGIGEERQQGASPEEGYILSRAFPDRETPALVLLSNSLRDLLALLRERDVTPQTTQVLCIDEVQLCTDQTPEEAIASLIELQRAGFTVVVNGIDYDFKADPFTHMHHLLLMSRFLPGWQSFQLTTLCKHCALPARGSRRIITHPDGRQQLADASSPVVMPCFSSYYAVCDEYHKSCTRPDGHVRQPLPTTLSLEEIRQTAWMLATLEQFGIRL